jgi:uncharacterized protein YecE (DUF72 family)
MQAPRGHCAALVFAGARYHPAAMKEGIRVGTVSWAKDHWVGPFYPEDLPKDGHLAHYAKSFDTVEVDATFYRTPSPQTCRAWRERTPDGFRFSLKVMKRVTHDKVLLDCGREMETFLGAIGELGDKFAYAVLQFGYFGKKSRCADCGSFLARLREFAGLCPDPGRFVVEVRNPEWLHDELLACLREHGFVFALTQVDRMPDPTAVWDRFGEKLVTGPAAYARIFGERKKLEQLTERYDRVLLDRTAETRGWVRIFRALQARNVPVWAYFSNYFAGYAPGSVELFRRLWAEG